MEKDILENYEILRRMAEVEPISVSGQASAKKKPETEIDDQHCTLQGIAEHARAKDSEEPCDDGRSGS